MSHTFHYNFRFMGLDLNYIWCTLMHSEGRCSINEMIPPCKLAKIRQIMMAFIHSEINMKHLPINDFEVHEQFGNHVFFHDRLIERWMCDIDIGVVSESFSMKGPSLSCIKECKYFVNKNIFLIFDNVRWRHGMGEDKLLIYVYDGDYFHSSFKKELTCLSDHHEKTTILIKNCKKGKQQHSVRVYRISKSFSIIDALHDLRYKFNHVSTVGGVIINRQIDRVSL